MGSQRSEDRPLVEEFAISVHPRLAKLARADPELALPICVADIEAICSVLFGWDFPEGQVDV